MVLDAIRDIAIVLLALESLIIGVLLALMLSQLRKLIKLLREEVAPMLDSANETVNTVHGTVDFVSHNVVDPLIKIKSYTAGAQQTLRSLFVISRRVRRRRGSGDQEL